MGEFPRVRYASCSDTTPEAELSTLADVYKFVLEASRKKKAVCPDRPEDPERRSDEIRAKSSVHQ